MEQDVSYIFEALVKHQLHMNLIDLKLYLDRYFEILKSF